MVGGSPGGQDTKMMVEDYPQEYDGGLAGYGINSHLEWMESNMRFVRNYDVFAPRIDDIVAKRTANRYAAPPPAKCRKTLHSRAHEGRFSGVPETRH